MLSKKIAVAIIFFGFIGIFRFDNPAIIFNNQAATQTETISAPEVITIKSRLFASQPMLLAPYKTMDVFTSPVEKSDFKFTSVGGYWEEIAPEGTHVDAEVRFEVNGEWSDWIDMEEEADRITIGRIYAMGSTNPATAFQYRYFLFGDGNKVPLVKNAKWTFIKAGEQTVTAKPAPRPKYSSYQPLSTATYLALNTDTLTGDSDVISRAQWGANESYRYVADNNAPVQLVQLDPEFYSKYADELKYSRIVEADENGDKYKWPLQYPEKVEKIIIHHTATTGNLDNPAQAIRDIYHYHAITRGWGDIGYNYIIDQQGKIYEGRYGGEGVIGAHSGPGNHGSIGIAFLGNYQDNDILEESVVKASQFLYKKSKIHNIDTQGSSEFRGKDRQNIMGHRDIMSTQCPGEYLYSKIPIIRVLAAQNFNLKEKFVKDYDYQDLSEIYYLELKPEQTLDITLKLENIGKNDWNNATTIKLENENNFDGIIPNTANMQEASVKSGATGTFKFTVKVGKKAETVYLNIIPLMNGKNTADEKIVIPITIQQPVYKYELVDKKMPEGLIKAGDTVSGFVTLKNKGNVSWEKTGNGRITLASNILDISADLKEETVAAGEIGTFEFNFTAPKNAGYYKVLLNPVMENATWISSSEVAFEVTVYERDYDSELLSKMALKQWEQGNSYTISVNLRNVGMKDWTKDSLKVTFVRANDLEISELTLTPAVVHAGEAGTISFTAQVGQNAKLGKNVLLIRPKIDKEILSRTPFYFYYKVVEKELQSSADSSGAGDTVRVKIGFSGDPEITANGPFKVYAGNNFLTNLSGGELAIVSREDGKYRIKAGDANFLKSEIVRIVPDSNAILKIKNFNHQPSWNQNLNDNEYRGILEVREVDGELTVIDELPLEDYMKGLAEVSNDEEPEKIKAIVIAARTYAQYYITIDKKFEGKPYNLDDNPDVTQKYLGYGFEKRAPNVTAAVNDTKGKVITYQGKIVITPYFNQSDGTRTKSAEEAWGWKDKPYLVSVDDTYCDGDTFLGHGVGLSGCGAKAMAQQGKNYEEILKHYYTGVEITDLY